MCASKAITRAPHAVLSGEPGVVEAESSMMSKPTRVTQEEAAYWKRTDNIILTVLSR
jgi:hypothetical protein